jgi:DUF971 family protein
MALFESRSNARENLRVKKIYQVDRHTLGIDWTDGHQSQYRLSFLRRQCPCASCIDEWTREKLLDPKSVSEDLVATRVESVGRYALRISFSDGHDTGLYTFTYLRELEAAAAKDTAS